VKEVKLVYEKGSPSRASTNVPVRCPNISEVVIETTRDDACAVDCVIIPFS
jgi:hypothetical protein